MSFAGRKNFIRANPMQARQKTARGVHHHAVYTLRGSSYEISDRLIHRACFITPCICCIHAGLSHLADGNHRPPYCTHMCSSRGCGSEFQSADKRPTPGYSPRRRVNATPGNPALLAPQEQQLRVRALTEL